MKARGAGDRPHGVNARCQPSDYSRHLGPLRLHYAEEDIDRVMLGELFSRAFIRVSYDNDGDLWAQDSDAPKLMIPVDLVRRMIRIAVAWRFKPETDPDARQRLAARTNAAFMMRAFGRLNPSCSSPSTFSPTRRASWRPSSCTP